MKIFTENSEVVVAYLKGSFSFKNEEVLSPCERCNNSINNGIYLEGSYLCNSCLEIESKLIKKPYGLTGEYFYGDILGQKEIVFLDIHLDFLEVSSCLSIVEVLVGSEFKPISEVDNPYGCYGRVHRNVYLKHLER